MCEDLRTAFVCRSCGQPIGDPLYHGPTPHAPANFCLDCWLGEWVLIEARMINGGHWEVLDTALWLVCCGISRQRVAELLGLHRNTVRRWLLRMRTSPHEMPDWLRARVDAVRAVGREPGR